MIKNKYRHLFPALNSKVNGQNLIYLDSAATSMTLTSVIESESNYYNTNSSNIHRGIHTLSQEATTSYEDTRQITAKFLNAKRNEEIVLTKGTTDSINLLAHSIGLSLLNKGDEIIISALDHHSNIIPWQIAAQTHGLIIKQLPLNDDCSININQLKEIITPKTKLISFTLASNTLGNKTPAKEIIQIANENKIITVIDAAQAAPHFKVDVQDLNCDFLVFSAHKMFGPTGVGILYGKYDILNSLPPYQSGGGMIDDVSLESSTYLDAPQKFEAGTPNISGAISFKKALEFLITEDIEKLEKQEIILLEYAHLKLNSIEGLRILGPQDITKKVAVVSFLMDGIHPNDIGMLLDEQGIAIRTGNHCTQPLMKFLNISGTCRASFACYNTKEEIDILYNALIKIKSFF